MLDTPPQDKLYRRLQVFNACEHLHNDDNGRQ